MTEKEVARFALGLREAERIRTMIASEEEPHASAVAAMSSQGPRSRWKGTLLRP